MQWHTDKGVIMNTNDFSKCKIGDELAKLKESVKPEPEWIPFTATEDSVCPVDPDIKVIIKLKNGEILLPEFATRFNWRRIVGNCSERTISAYKIVG